MMGYGVVGLKMVTLGAKKPQTILEHMALKYFLNIQIGCIKLVQDLELVMFLLMEQHLLSTMDYTIKLQYMKIFI